MLLFIGLPIISSFFQSLHIEPEQILMEVEKCDPFGCKTETKVDIEATNKLQEEQLPKIHLYCNYGLINIIFPIHYPFQTPDITFSISLSV